MNPSPTVPGPSLPKDVALIAPGDRLVCIGAGPAGLTAAYVMAKRGTARVSVLEGSQMLGGISRTVRHKGYRFDIGGHRFLTKIASVEALWHEILGSEFIQVSRRSRIYYRGRYFDYPLKPLNALAGLGPFEAMRVLLSYARARMWPNPIEENFEQWVSNRFGKRLYRTFFKLYTEKVWGIPCTEIRAEWAAQRIQNLSLVGALRNAGANGKVSKEVKSLTDRFQYPRLGPGQMWETCAEKIVGMGGEVLLKHSVEAVEHIGGRVTAVRVSTPEGIRRIEGEHFISTMPIRSLVAAMEPRPKDSVVAAGNSLRYRDFLVVALILDADNLFPDNWIYIHTPGIKVGRIQNFNNWSAAMAPEKGRTCLGMEYFCFEGDSLWASSDQDLVDLATQELARLGLADATLVLDGSVVRVPKAYPIYDAGYRDHLDHVRRYLDRFSNLHSVGRNGMHKYNNQDHSMLTAMLAVENMHGALHDLWSINTDFEYHEEQRLEGLGPDSAQRKSP